MRRKKWLKIATVVVVALALPAAYVGHRMGVVGLAFAAQSLCTSIYVTSRDGQEAWDKNIVGNIFPLGLISRWQAENEIVTVSAPLLGKRHAVYRGRLGCTTVVLSDPQELALQRIVLPAPITPSSGEWPQGDRLSTKADAAIRGSVQAVVSEHYAENHDVSDALLVAWKGQLIAERYASDWGPNRPHAGWSMSKSVLNNLVGLLVKDGAMNIDAVANVPAWQAEGEARAAITIQQLLQMSSGLKFSETYSGFDDASQMLYRHPSTAQVAMNSKLAHPPGEHFSYSSGTSNILGYLVQAEVGGTPEDIYRLLYDRLLHPLGITSAVFEPDEAGLPIMSSRLHMSAQDWLRLGQFWLQNGRWQGLQMLPEEWMTQSTQPASAAPEGRYGLHFWLNAGEPDNTENRAFPSLPAEVYWAGGYNGQRLFVVPSQELLILRLGSHHNRHYLNEADLVNQILLALSSAPAEVPENDLVTPEAAAIQ